MSASVCNRSSVAAAGSSCLASSYRPRICAARLHGLTTTNSRSRPAGQRHGALQPAQHSSTTTPAQPQPCSRLLVRAEPEGEGQVAYNKEFGYSRKDVLIIIVALIALGVLMYEGLQATGMSPGMAGNWVQLTIFLGICVGWVSTYLWRVANKKMTYAQQLQMYEEAVMQKRLEEMTEAELTQLLSEVEMDKQQLQAAKAALQKQQQRSASQ